MRFWALRHQEGCYAYSTGATQFRTAQMEKRKNEGRNEIKTKRKKGGQERRKGRKKETDRSKE